MKWLVRLMLCLVISFSLVEMPMMKAHAGMISTTDAVMELTRAQGEETVAKFLDRGEVKEQLINLGVNPEEASKRIAGLSDREVNKLAGDIQKAQAGGQIVGILLVVLLVLGIIYFAKRV